jgi:cytochrome c biogenesis factor
MSVPHEALDFERSGFSRQLSLRDWAFLALMAAFVMTALGLYGAHMDGCDIGGILDLMYRAIALGFAFFTIATVLGAMGAAEAWRGYWSWGPEETRALIVWLNYAAWLHMRFPKGWRGASMAWWSVVGLFITTFAFLGVNTFLSGLHSYGEL